MVITHKGTDDVRPMFRKTRAVVGKKPSNFMYDGAPQLCRGPPRLVRAAQLPEEELGARATHQDKRRHQQQPDGDLQQEHTTNTLEGGPGAEEE